MTEQEFNRAAERHLDMVYRIALNWLKRPADAEDAAQNVMLRLWRTDAAFAGEDHTVGLMHCARHDDILCQCREGKT